MNTHVEKKIVIFLNKLHWVPLDFASKIISNIAFLSVLWFAVIIFAMSIDFSFGLDIFVKLIMVFILHYIISEGIIKHGAKKLSLQRIRPYVAFPKEIRGIGRNFSDSSFPSSHMASVTGGLVILFSAFPVVWPALLAFAVLLAFSRLHNGMHYPSDILAGIFLGLMYGNIVLALF
ncbi:MAG: hypothetical protein ACD_14C00037G0004 [uncultured bacterium]|nr:MAG: hypothetical protein ACD_14C00037G0004 [uncultured bacterium]KKQ45812.1 MAG: phosphatase [Candidatus Moranbacteria bacterium GW2011_GWC2_37_8]KKQ63349.1 MAG: phosphatase [Parcubacteria group bacterium GW2011_GWC1_38_22]